MSAPAAVQADLKAHPSRRYRGIALMAALVTPGLIPNRASHSRVVRTIVLRVMTLDFRFSGILISNRRTVRKRRGHNMLPNAFPRAASGTPLGSYAPV